MHAEAAGLNFSTMFAESVRKSLIEADPSFDDVHEEVFANELTTLRFELFGLARLGSRRRAGHQPALLVSASADSQKGGPLSTGSPFSV